MSTRSTGNKQRTLCTIAEPPPVHRLNDPPGLFSHYEMQMLNVGGWKHSNNISQFMSSNELFLCPTDNLHTYNWALPQTHCTGNLNKPPPGDLSWKEGDPPTKV